MEVVRSQLLRIEHKTKSDVPTTDQNQKNESRASLRFDKLISLTWLPFFDSARC